MLQPYLAVGEVLKPQGVRGELKIKPITSDVTRFETLSQVYLEKDGEYAPARVRVTRIEPDAVYMMFEGVRDRDEADKLRGTLLYVDRAHAIELPDDSNFICDLIGCEARDDRGREIGRLTEVLQPGASDVYVFKGPLGEVLVPALKRAVLAVDVREKTMLLSASALDEVAVFETP